MSAPRGIQFISARETEALRALYCHYLNGAGGTDLTAAGVAWSVGLRGERLGHAAGPWLRGLRSKGLAKRIGAGLPAAWGLTARGRKVAERLVGGQ